MKELKADLLTTKYTKVLEEENYKYNAPPQVPGCKSRRY